MMVQCPSWMVTIRIIGNIGTIIGYGILLHVDPLWGSIIKMSGFSLITPFCYRAKLYDVLFIAAVFSALDLSNIIKILAAG